MAHTSGHGSGNVKRFFQSEQYTGTHREDVETWKIPGRKTAVVLTAAGTLALANCGEAPSNTPSNQLGGNVPVAASGPVAGESPSPSPSQGGDQGENTAPETQASPEADTVFAFLDSLSPEEFAKQPPEMRAQWALGMYEKVLVSEIKEYRSTAPYAKPENSTDPSISYLGEYLLQGGDETGDNGQEILNKFLARQSIIYAAAANGDWDDAQKLMSAMIFDPASTDGSSMVPPFVGYAQEHLELGETSSTKRNILQTNLRSIDDGVPGAGLIDIDVDGKKYPGRRIIGNQSGNDATYEFVAVTLPSGDTILMANNVRKKEAS